MATKKQPPARTLAELRTRLKPVPAPKAAEPLVDRPPREEHAQSPASTSKERPVERKEARPPASTAKDRAKKDKERRERLERLTQGYGINEIGAGGFTPLVYAASRGNQQDVQFLLDNGAQIDGRSHSGETALIAACRNKHFDVAKFLIEQGADVHAEDNEHANALYWTQYWTEWESDKDSVERTMLERGVKNKIRLQKKLREAIRKGNLKGVQRAVEEGADVNMLHVYGFSPPKTPLMRAVTCGEYSAPAIVSYLLSKGADKSIKTPQGETALSIAKGWCRTEKVVALLEAA